MKLKELLLGTVVIARVIQFGIRQRQGTCRQRGNGEFLVGTFAISPSTRKRPQSISMTS